MRKSVHCAAAETGKQFVQTANTDDAGVPVYPRVYVRVCVLRVCCVCVVCVVCVSALGMGHGYCVLCMCMGHMCVFACVSTPQQRASSLREDVQWCMCVCMCVCVCVLNCNEHRVHAVVQCVCVCVCVCVYSVCVQCVYTLVHARCVGALLYYNAPVAT
jgi:hypothetical protein